MNEIDANELLDEVQAIRRGMEIAANNWQERLRSDAVTRAPALQGLVDSLDAAAALLAQPLSPVDAGVVRCAADVGADPEARAAATRWAALLRERAEYLETAAADARLARRTRLLAAGLSSTLETAAHVLAMATTRDDMRVAH